MSKQPPYISILVSSLLMTFAIDSSLPKPSLARDITGYTSSTQSDFVIENRTAGRIIALYISASNIANWQQNLLADRPLQPGESIAVRFPPTQQECLHDIRGVFSDGSIVENSHINLCNASSYTFLDDR
jgi:hypothetical protein